MDGHAGAAIISAIAGAEKPQTIEQLARVPREEFEERQARARSLAAERGLDAILAWSRGASSQDRYVEVYYLANFYTHFPFIPDDGSRWQGRGHTALVVPVDGPSTLVVDLPQFREDLVVADELVVADDVVGACAEAIAAAVPTGATVGVLGCEAVAWRWWERLRSETEATLVDADELGPILRLVKSDAEARLLRAAGALGVEVVEAILDASVPGVTEAEAAGAGVARLVAAGGSFYGMGLSSGPNAHMYSPSHPAPWEGRYRLQEGDMVRLDAYGSLDGYLFDFGRTRVVGTAPTAEQEAMLAAVRESVQAGAELLRPGNTLGTVARRCDEIFAESEFVRSGLGMPPAFGSWGHSLGLAWEPPWIDAASDVVIEPGMCLALEKRVAQPGRGGATYEDDYLVTADGHEVLTPARIHFS